MSATTWFIIAIVGFSLAGIALAIAIALFVKLNIPAVIGDLSGKTIAREIKAMRDVNTASGDKTHRSSRVNIDRGKLTEKVEDLPELVDENSIAKAQAHSDKRLDKTEDGLNEIYEAPTSRKTASLTEDVSEISVGRVTDVLVESRATEVLTEAKQTEFLAETKQTEVLLDHNGTANPSETRQTELLVEEPVQQYQTTVLDDSRTAESQVVTPISFKITRSIVEIHTDEVI